MEYRILESSVPLYSKNFPLSFLPFIFSIPLSFPLNFYVWNGLGFMVVGITFLFAIGSIREKKVDKRTIGELSISPEGLSAKPGNNFLTQNIKSLHLINNGYEGMMDNSKDSNHGTTGIAEITINNQEGNSTTIRFIIDNREQYLHLREILKLYYKLKISITESYGYKTKALLLEPLKSYKRTQELKKELDIL